MKTYDYLIVGTGLFGAVFGHLASKQGKSVLMIDKKNHIGGMTYTKQMKGIEVHMYGAHIFHTSNRLIWDFVNQFSEFNHFMNAPLAYYKKEMFNLPFNMNTFNQMWGVTTPEQAQKKIEKQRQKHFKENPQNLEEQAINLVGLEIYEKLIKGYTEKQWGKDCKDLPPFIIKRLPVRFTYDNNYFNDTYQGIPIGGYTNLIQNMIKGIDLILDCDFFENKETLTKHCKKIVYTGPIDQYFDYKHGVLSYRSLRFEHQCYNMKNYQGNAVINYTDKDVPYTRIIEHKHFEFGNQDHTIISKEYPEPWTFDKDAYYPINDSQNQINFQKYKNELINESIVIFSGRLAEYKYLNMNEDIISVMEKYET